MAEPSDSGPLRLSDLDEIPVDRLNGVGDKRRAGLAEVGIGSVFDLLTHYPRRYIDRTREARVVDMIAGDEAMVVGEVVRVESRRTRNRRSLVQVDIKDDTGRLRATFFNQQWRAKQLKEGLVVALFGKLESYQGQPQMTNPVVDLVGDRTGRIVPVYPQSEKAGLMTWEIAGWVSEALRRCQARGLGDPLPAVAMKRYGFLDRNRAFAEIHSPRTMADTVGARTRLVFDELFRVQLSLLRRKLEFEAASSGVTHQVEGSFVEEFPSGLGFALTGAQVRAMAEIDRDLSGIEPMHRLLQGDVGSGKTLVAVHALLVAVQGGHQGAFMAPTEVLAEQHNLSVRAMVDGLEVLDSQTLTGRRPLRVELLTNRVGAVERRRVLAGLADGSVDIAIGTHALIQDAVEFASLGCVVVDEQHRFGVEQRSMLRERGRPDGLVPDLLVMTATPIPRTAAMTVYGDLDVSVLDELPPGRTPITTRWIRSEEESAELGSDVTGGEVSITAMWEMVRSELEQGRQAYVVCPLIEDSDKLEATSAEATFDALRQGELSTARVGLLHGRLDRDAKDVAMAAFRAGEIDVLVATTVIEVGVDVPNATVMVVLSADRFGIAQLHQLRGRVGRGSSASMCFLVSAPELTADGAARLEAMERTTDGFELAEVDLDLRGEGTIFDERQSGRNDLKLASLRRDREWVVRARELAAEVLEADPSLAKHPLLRDELNWFETAREEHSDYLLRS